MVGMSPLCAPDLCPALPTPPSPEAAAAKLLLVSATSEAGPWADEEEMSCCSRGDISKLITSTFNINILKMTIFASSMNKYLYKSLKPTSSLIPRQV